MVLPLVDSQQIYSMGKMELNAQNMDVLVTVAIPSYNYGHFIGEAIASVLAQTFTDYEIIAIDDGSTDNTKQTLQPFWDKIRYVKQENQGLSAARNKAICLAKGKYILFLDADDFLLPEMLENQVKAISTDDNLGLVVCGWHIAKESGEIVSNVELWKHIGELTPEALVKYRSLIPSATLFRRHWLQKVGGFSQSAFPAEDIDCVLKMLAQGCQSRWVKKIGVCYRQHGQNITRNVSRQVAAFERLYDGFFANGKLPYKLAQIENEARYYTLLWCAWRFYHAGNLKEMVRYLRKTIPHNSFTSGQLIESWVECFANCSTAQGDRFNSYAFTTTPGWRSLIETVLVRKVPDLSIIIIANGANESLRTTIESILAQSDSNYEVIVIVCSSTEEKEIVSLYGDSIRCVHYEHQEILAAKKRGLNLARGRGISFFDAGEVVLPENTIQQMAVYNNSVEARDLESRFRVSTDVDNTMGEVK